MRSTLGRQPRGLGALKDKHTFKAEMDDEARRHMFPQNAVRAA
jgi:hypothetical protein